VKPLRHPLGRIGHIERTRPGLPKVRVPRHRLPQERLWRRGVLAAEFSEVDSAPETLAEQSLATQSKLLTPVSPAREPGRFPLRRVIVWAALLLVCLAGLGAFTANVLWRTGGEPREATVFIAPGVTFAQVAQSLQKQGIIHDAGNFLLLVRFTESGGKLRAGEYLVNAAWEPLKVIEQLTRGQPILHRLQVREGLAWWEVGRLVEEAGLGTYASFERAVHDAGLLARLNLPFDSAEGFLFPETYLLPRNPENDARPVVEHMIKEFWKTAREVWPEGAPNGPELFRLVTLASIVEKETGQGSERAKVAGVYANRLRIGMAMQADPTVIYGIGPSFDGNLRKPDLENAKNAYNTYQHPGLPPGPICSPGKAALDAAAHPEQHSFLYFVSRKDGTHEFSKNLDDHNAAVRKFQLRKH